MADVADGAELGCGLADAAGPDCTDHWTGTELAGQFGAAATVTWVSFPAARQAWTVMVWGDTPPWAAARFNVAGARLFSTANPPMAAAIIRQSTVASPKLPGIPVRSHLPS